jgi:hypothetical protein
MDGPGHYFRRIKSLALSIPCVTGPYTSVNCTLGLRKSAIRTSALVGDGYARAHEGDDSRFSEHFGSLEAIVTSSGQNDSGLFEANLRDERYLPFEGSGVISEWQLELPADIRQFDYDTISDVILHLRYTAREGGALLKGKAIENVKAWMASVEDAGPLRLFSVRHDFPSAWAKFKSVSLPDAAPVAELTLKIERDHFPFWSQGKDAKPIVPKALMLLTQQGSERVDVSDGSGAKDTLNKDASLGGLCVRTLANVALPAPISDSVSYTLYFSDNTMKELWLLLAWRKDA